MTEPIDDEPMHDLVKRTRPKREVSAAEDASTPRTAALKTKIASTIRMLQLLNESIESVERGNPKTDKADCDLREVATMCGDLRVELARGKR